MAKADVSVSLAAVLGVTAITLVVGYALKQGCFALGLAESYSFYCHSDVGPLYYARDLAGGRFPYEEPALEYPVGLGLIIWAASIVSSSAIGFWLANVYLVAVAALVTVWLLWREAKHLALFFAAAPTLALYAFLNWDLL